MNDELKKLYDVLLSKGYYTKSFDEFVVKYQEPEYRDKLFGVVTRDGLYTKSREEFDAKYSVQPLKKKEPSEVSSQEERLASPMETPSLATLPGRDLTLPPSPSLALETRQAIEQAGGVLPEEQPIPVPDEARPTEVTTDDGITLDLETGGIEGETGVAPEAMEAMQERVKAGDVAMPEAVDIADLYNTLQLEERERIEGVKKSFNKITGLGAYANAGVALISQLYPAAFPGAESLDKAASEINQAYLEASGLPPEDTRKGFTEQSSFKNGAIKLGVDVANTMGLSILAGLTMGAAAPALGVGTLSTFGLGASAEGAGIAGLLQAARRTVAGNIARDPLTFGMMGYVGANGAWKEVASNPSMSTEEKVAYSTFAGLKEMFTEGGFVGDFRAWNKALSLGERVAAKDTFKEVFKDFTKSLRKQGLEEGTEEGVSWSGDLIWNYLSGQELPTARSGWEAIAIGALAPSAAVTSQYAPAMIDYATAVLPYTLPNSNKLSKLSDLKSKSAKIEQDINTEGISSDEKDKLTQAKAQIDEEIYSLRQESFEERKDMSREDQMYLATTDARIEGLYEEFSNAKTGSAKSIIKQEVKSLLNEKRKIETKDAIQEQAAGEVPVQPEATVGEEVAQGTTQTEPEVATQEGVEEEVALTEEEQQQLEALRGETLGKVPTEGATVEEVTSIFEKGRKLSDNLVVNEQGAQPLTKEQTRIEKLAVRGAKAIQKLLPDVKVVLHASADTYAQSAADTAEGRGTYDDSTKTIHINLATADASTVAHEVFHAIFLNKVKTDPKAQAVAKRMMESVRKTLPDNSALAVEIDKFAKDYDASFQNEERLAQLMGAMSREYVNATSTVKGQIVEFIKRLARAFNVLLPSEFGKTDQSVTAMLDVLSRKVAKGKEIVAADLVVLDRSAEPGSTVVSGTVAENISDKGAKPIDINAKRRQQLNRGGIDMAAIKRGSINDLSGANAFVFAADQATYGEIESPSGAKYNFKGGYLYPYGSGMAWAFTTEAAANKILKKAQQSDGVGLVMSQASDGITGSMSFYEYMLEEIKNAVANGAKESDIVAYVNEKLKVTEVQDALNKKGKPLQIKKLAELENLMPIEGQGKFSYEERSAFTKVFFSAKSYEQFGIPPLKPTAKMSTGVLDFVNDPSLEKAQYGDIISAIQFNKDSKIIDTRKEGMDVHPSYPFAIEGAPLMVFNNAVDVRKVYPDAKPKTGAQVELGKRAKPQAARSAMGAQYVAEVPSEIIEEPTVITLEADNAMRRQKGLITVTPSESLKYKRAGIEDKYQQQAVKMAAELISAATRYRDEGGMPTIESRLSFALSENKGNDVNSIVASINKSSPGLSPPEALDVFINRVNYSISGDLALDDRYLGASLNIVDGPAVTSAILFEASQAEEMGLSRAIVASLKEKAKEGSSERRQVIDEYQRTQHSTLDKWARYLRNGGPSSWAPQPSEAIATRDMSSGLKLMLVDAVITHNYDAATGKYIKRTNKTLRNYTPYDEGTISRLFAEGNPASNALLKEYVELMASNATNVVKAFKLEDTAEGTWLKFPGGASVSGDNLNLNANALSQLVQDTPWCTKNSAVGQLSGGDFYVFVTEEKNGDPKPRVAIKTTNGRLDEARGILDGQQMEPRMRPVFEAFLQKDILTDGAKWLEGQRFNERVKGFREEILKRPLSFEDFTTMDELKQEAGRYSFMQYGQNGFLERLQEDLDIKIAQDDFVTELKGKVAAHSEDLKSTTEILIANFDGEAVFLNIMRDLALTMMKDGKTIQDIGHATLPVQDEASRVAIFERVSLRSGVADVASSVFGNLEQFPNSLMRDLVLVRGGGLYQVESVLASLIEAYGKQKATQLLSAAVLDKTKSLKKIGDVFDPIFLPIPQSLKVVGKSVIIKQGNNTGNIISANRLTIYNNTPDFEIGVVKVTQKVSIEEPIKSLGKLEEVGTINAAYGRWSDLESLGNLTSVFDGNLRLEGSKITSLGNLKYVHERLGVPEAVTTLGKLEEVGDLSVTGSVGRLESLGNLRKAGWISVQLERGSNLKDLGKLEQIQSLDILEGSNSLKSLGPHLKAVDELSIMGNALIPDFGALEEVVGSLNLYSDKPVHSLGKIKKVGRMFASNLASFSSLETVEGDLEVWPSEDLKDTGKLKSVGGHLIVGKNSTKKEMGDEFRITNLESVAGNVTIYSERVRSLGSIQTIGGRLSLGVGAAQNVRSLGALRAESVGSYFIDNSAHYDTNTELLAQVAERQAENMRAEEGIAPPNAKGVPFGNQYVPSVRRQKGASISYQNWSAKPQSKAQRVGHRFNMNHNGFTPLTIDPAQFKIAVQNLHNRLGVMRHPDERTGKVNGYSMTLDGKFFNPFLKVIQESGNSNSLRRQGYGAGTQNIYEFIEDTRGRGYTDRVISAFLKEQGYSSAEIKDAIAVPIDVLGNTLPDGFANVEGGVTVGQALFNEILDKVQKYATAKRLGILLHTQADVRAKAQELLVDADTFKAQGPVVQAEMQIGLDKALNITSANKKFQADFKALRTMLTNVKKGVSEMNKAKAALRMFIRKNLPKSQYTKADVNKLMKAITDATPDTLPAVMQRVTGYVNGFFVRNLNAEIAKIMSTKTTTTQAGRRVGRISVEAQNAMAKLTSKTNPMMANEDMTPDQIEAMIVAQLTEFEALSIKSAPTSDEMTRMEALGIAMQYNQASLHEDTNPHKVESLTQVKTNLRSLIATGRSDFRAAMAIQAQYYSNLVGEAFRGITGEKIDLSPDAAKENENAARESANKQANKSSFNNRVKGSMSGFFNNIDDFWAKHSDLSLLMSRITGVMAENFGGPMQEIVTDRLSFARETFVSNKLKVMALLNSKAKEIWGSEYKTELERNAIPLFSKNLVTDKNTVFLKPKEATALRKEYEKADKKRKGKILNRLKELEIKNLSKNQIYYLYNQYKDPANHPSFEKKFGEEYVDIMDGLTAKLDSKTKEWADWQVNELYPSLYDGYNEVYKRIYHTNMPWNQFYAGRIYREGQEGDMTFDLLEGAGNHQASVGGQSTKMRIKNLRKIASMDGNSVLNSYLEDMEYFSAYAEVMRDMSKVFENENVKNAIIEMAGLNTHTAISDMLKKIANRGIRANESPIMNKIMGMYVTSKLGSSPVIMLKQFTSALAFVDYIGPTTWSSYMAKAMAENPAKVWNEWYNNSPLLILRYENSNIAQVLEGYTQKRAMNTTPFLVQTKILGKELTISQRKALEIQNFMMYMVKQGDKGGIMGGLPNYLYYKDQFMKANPQATEQEAIEHAATKTTRQALSTQQDSGIANKDWYQTAGPGYRFVNLFLSSPKALLRKEMYAVMNLMRKIQGKPSQGTALENMRTFFIYHFAIPMFFAWVTSGLIGLLSDPDDEDEQELAIAAIMGNLNALFVIGDLAVAAKEFIQDKSWAGEFKTLPLFEQAQQVIKDLGSWSKAKTPETEQKYFDKLINHATESVSGVPVTNMRRWMDNIEKLANGNVGNTQEAMLRFLNYSNYVIDGPGKKKPAGMSEIDRLMLERSGGNKKSQQN